MYVYQIIFNAYLFAILQRGYRVKLDEQQFTVPSDRVDLVRAKNAAEVLNEVRMTRDDAALIIFVLKSFVQLYHLIAKLQWQIVLLLL